MQAHARTQTKEVAFRKHFRLSPNLITVLPQLRLGCLNHSCSPAQSSSHLTTAKVDGGRCEKLDGTGKTPIINHFVSKLRSVAMITKNLAPHWTLLCPILYFINFDPCCADSGMYYQCLPIAVPIYDFCAFAQTNCTC